MRYFKWEQGSSIWYIPTNAVTAIEKTRFDDYLVYVSDGRCFRFVIKPEEVDLGE